MNLTLWNRSPVIDEFARARDDMDRMLGRFLGTGMLGTGLLGTGLPAAESRLARLESWSPAIDVSESADEVVVRAEMPGIASRDLEISMTGNVLSISGRKEEKEEVEHEDFFRSERRFGSFRRLVELPESIDPERIAADSENGVVTIRVAKKPGQRARRIEVKPVTRRVTVPS